MSYTVVANDEYVELLPVDYVNGIPSAAKILSRLLVEDAPLEIPELRVTVFTDTGEIIEGAFAQLDKYP